MFVYSDLLMSTESAFWIENEVGPSLLLPEGDWQVCGSVVSLVSGHCNSGLVVSSPSSCLPFPLASFLTFVQVFTSKCTSFTGTLLSSLCEFVLNSFLLPCIPWCTGAH